MMGHRDNTIGPRLIGAATLVLGVVLATQPRRVSQAVSGDRAVSQGWVRLLGARYLVQGTAQLGWPSPAVLRAAPVVDGLHALSMFTLATVQPDYRRPALVSAVTASTGATANTLTALRRHGVRR